MAGIRQVKSISTVELYCPMQNKRELHYVIQIQYLRHISQIEFPVNIILIKYLFMYGVENDAIEN